MGEISYVDEYDKPLLNNISNKPLQGNSTLCGATEQENHEQLDDFVQQMADSNHISKDDCYKELKKWYEGYHLHPNSVDVYNPFGLMRALYSCAIAVSERLFDNQEL